LSLQTWSLDIDILKAILSYFSICVVMALFCIWFPFQALIQSFYFFYFYIDVLMCNKSELKTIYHFDFIVLFSSWVFFAWMYHILTD